MPDQPGPPHLSIVELERAASRRRRRCGSKPRRTRDGFGPGVLGGWPGFPKRRDSDDGGDNDDNIDDGCLSGPWIRPATEEVVLETI